MKNKRILVTGGAGFIGSHITTELIKQGTGGGKVMGLISDVHELTKQDLLSNPQMESLAPKITDALYEVGKELPEYCAEIYAQCIQENRH